MRYLLDTSVWLRGYFEPDSVPTREGQMLGRAGEVFGLSAISLWEVGKKHQTGKLPLPKELAAWFKDALGVNIHLVPLTPEVVAEAMRLPEFPVRDPADELIVATARAHNLTLLTTDTKLKGYRHARIHYFTPVLVL
jgi:PIN domain nuclease of toxin-antitoxin system